jgi:hypothetical protein
MRDCIEIAGNVTTVTHNLTNLRGARGSGSRGAADIWTMLSEMAM